VNPLAELKAKLARYPQLRFVETPTSLRIEAPTETGFSVSLDAVAVPNEYVVYFDGWHEHFQSPEEALHCVAFAFSGQARLAITYRGNTAVKWVLEHQVNGEWRAVSETGNLLVPFWQEPHVVYRQNPTLIKPAA
jgi:hypothetical protein